MRRRASARLQVAWEKVRRSRTAPLLCHYPRLVIMLHDRAWKRSMLRRNQIGPRAVGASAVRPHQWRAHSSGAKSAKRSCQRVNKCPWRRQARLASRTAEQSGASVSQLCGLASASGDNNNQKAERRTSEHTRSVAVAKQAKNKDNCCGAGHFLLIVFVLAAVVVLLRAAESRAHAQRAIAAAAAALQVAPRLDGAVAGRNLNFHWAK